MKRIRRRASDVAGDMASPKLFVIFMVGVALSVILFVKCGAQDYTDELMTELVGDPELALPPGYLETLDRGIKPANSPAR